MKKQLKGGGNGLKQIANCYLFEPYCANVNGSLSEKSERLMAQEASIFKKIIQGQVPADILYQDDRVTAFRDITPQAPSHILIVPNSVIATLDDLRPEDAELLGHMVIVATTLARQQGIAKAGYRLIINCNQHGGQEVRHLHLHLVGGHPLGPMLCHH